MVIEDRRLTRNGGLEQRFDSQCRSPRIEVKNLVMLFARLEVRPAMMFAHDHGELDAAAMTHFAVLPLGRGFGDEHGVRLLQHRKRVTLVLHQVVRVHDGLRRQVSDT